MMATNEDGELSREFNAIREAHAAGLHLATAARCRDFLATRPDCGPAWRLLGSSLISLARYSEAEEAIQKAMTLCPVELLWIPLCEMGRLNRARGAFEAAASWYRRAMDAAPDDAGPRIYLAGVLSQGGQLIEAETVLQAAILCDQGCRDEAHLNLALVLRSLDREEEARAEAEAALSIDPDYASAKELLRDLDAVAAFRKEAAGEVAGGETGAATPVAAASPRFVTRRHRCGDRYGVVDRHTRFEDFVGVEEVESEDDSGERWMRLAGFCFAEEEHADLFAAMLNREAAAARRKAE